MNEDFVTYEIAKKLKEKGFHEECLCFFNTDEELADNINSPIVDRMYYSWNSDKSIWNGGNFDAPTISQVLKWLREEKKLHIVMDITKAYPSCNILCWGFIVFDVLNGDIIYFEHNRDSYEQAALAGIEYVLDNIIKVEPCNT